MNDEKQDQKWHPITGVVIVLGMLGVLLAIAIPSFVRVRNTSCQQACINNLRMIDSGKEQAARAYGWEGAITGKERTTGLWSNQVISTIQKSPIIVLKGFCNPPFPLAAMIEDRRYSPPLLYVLRSGESKNDITVVSIENCKSVLININSNQYLLN